MRRIPILVALVLTAAACGDAGPAGTAATSAAPTTTTTAAATTTFTLPPTTTTTTLQITDLPEPLTNRAIDQDELMLMTLENPDLAGLFIGFGLDQRLGESNAEAIRKSVLDTDDEAADVEGFGREAGARAIFRRGSPDDQGVTELHVWVALFRSDGDASGYLADWVLDAAKSIGGGHPAALQITGIERFDVAGLGTEALAVELEETAPGDAEPSVYETLVAVRTGRLLAYSSLVAVEDTDVRTPALRLAEKLNEQVLGVLRGNIRPEEPPPPPEELSAYAFSFRQNIFRPRTTAEVTADGLVVLPSSLQCDVIVEVDDFPEVKHYVTIGDRAWYDLPLDVISGFTEVDIGTRFIAADLLFCPGWSIFAVDSGIDLAVLGEIAERVEVDGRPARAYTMGKEQLIDSGFLPDGSGLEVTRFDVRVDVANPWVLGLEIDLRGSAPQFVAAFGTAFEGQAGDEYRMEFRFEVTRVNDSTIEVLAP